MLLAHAEEEEEGAAIIAESLTVQTSRDIALDRFDYAIKNKLDRKPAGCSWFDTSKTPCFNKVF